MKKQVGSEISRVPQSKHILDLRDKSRRPIETVAPVQAPIPKEEVQAVGDLVIHDRVADDVARLGMHQEAEPLEPTSEPEPDPEPQTQPEKEPPPPKRKGLLGRLFKGPKLSRSLLVGTAKAVIVLAGAVWFLLLDIPLAERLIGIYFVASIVYNIDSQRTFIVALIFLVLVAISSAIGQSVPAESYAVYAFYFLVIGLFAAIREQITNRSKTVGGNSQLSD